MIMSDFDNEERNKEVKWIPRRQVYMLMTAMLMVGMIFFKIKILPTKVQFILALIIWLICAGIYPTYIVKANKNFKGTVVDFIVALICVAIMILIATFFLEPSYVDAFRIIVNKPLLEEVPNLMPHCYITICSVSVLLTAILGLFGKDR